jgi:hypothetical protein
VTSWQQQHPGQQYPPRQPYPKFSQPTYGNSTAEYLQAQPTARTPFIFGQQQQVVPARPPMTVVIHLPEPAAASSFATTNTAHNVGNYAAPGPYGGYCQMPPGAMRGYY